MSPFVDADAARRACYVGVQTVMSSTNPDEVTLQTLHEDVTAGFAGLRGEITSEFAGLRSELADIKSGIADLQVTLVVGFQSLPGRESAEETIRLLRESTRLQAETLRLVAALVNRRGNGGPAA